ncbi:uncharacterized protein LOC135848390 [Planococcus citri]|uniref:uncharacterized protein LOC135848390 n=1 Tax=Planococcus citri TaxID=170843 RepID=UPI0031F97D1B
MNFLYFFVSFEILFLSNNHPAEAKSENALIYNYEDKKLIEARQPIALCQTCLTACPASTDPEKKFDDDDSIAGNSLFVRKISSNSQNEKNMKINICDRQFQPSIIWDDKKKMYLTGYELYYEYEEGQIKLQCDEYDNFRQITNGKPNEKQSPSSDFVRRYKSEGNTIFHILDEESIIEKLVFFWIHVLSIGQTEHVRQITLFERDEINYYKFDMIECEDYNLGGGWKTFVTKVR